MSFRINSNAYSYGLVSSLNQTNSALARSMQRLSSGLRINSASDDPSGVGIASRLRSQLAGIQLADNVVQEGSAMVSVADTALGEIGEMLQRVRDLAIEYNSGTLDAGQQAAVISEVSEIDSAITALINNTDYNGIGLLNTGGGAIATLQVGPDAGDTFTLNGVDPVTAIGTALTDFIGGTPDLNTIDTAIGGINNERAYFGASDARLSSMSNVLAAQAEAVAGAETRISGVDMAMEMAELTRLQILQQSGMAMLAQANMQRASVLALLSGG